MIGAYTRPYTVTSLYEAVMYAGINPFSFFGLSINECPNVERPGGCDDLWVESSMHGEKKMTRQAFTMALHRAEQLLADYLGYWPGPKYIENERHYLGSWSRILTTKYNKVVLTGTRKRTLIGSADNVTGVDIPPQSKPLLPTPNPRPFQVSGASLFNSAVGPTVLNYGFSNNLATTPPLGFEDKCNILLYPEATTGLGTGSGQNDPNKELNDGFVMRPWQMVTRNLNVADPTKVQNIVIQVPLFAAIKPLRYFEVSSMPNKQNVVTALDACNPANWVDTIYVYRETYDKPDGFAMISKRDCRKCGGAGECTECTQPKLPICLIPIHPDRGRFKVQPLRETTIGGKKCWIPDDLESCCASLNQGYDSGISFNYRWTYQCYCTKPLEICINYVSSCHDCFGPECTTLGTCPNLLPALVKMTLANLPVLCKCECTHQMIDHMRHQYVAGGENAMQVYHQDQFDLGTRIGEVEAWQQIRHIRENYDRTLALL